MRLFFLTYFIVILSVLGSDAQVMQGIVVDGNTGKPIFFCTVVNLATNQSVSTNEEGKYSIAAKRDEPISFAYMGYAPVQRLAAPGTEFRVAMLPLGIQLDEYILHPNYTPFQKDSADLASLYSKELNTKPLKPQFGFNNGVEADGLIGAAVQKMSRSYKKNKKFKEQFKKDEEQKFIDTRYSPELVTAMTGFSGDTLLLFMNHYPMEYTFARTASDLELKMWVRDNYRNYLHRKME